MPSFPADPRRFHWSSPNGRSRGRFIPDGHFVWYGRKNNPEEWGDKGPIWAARLFVGLSIGHDSAWTENDVVRIVKQVRQKQVKRADASFVLQRGLYTQEVKGKKVVVDEQSVQIIILNLAFFKTSPKRFRTQMVALAEKLARDLEQKEVIIEIQRNGLYQETIGVGP